MFSIPNLAINRFWEKISNFIPDLLMGLFVLIIGLLIGNLLKKVVKTLITFFKIPYLLEKAKLSSKAQINIWLDILAEILRWTVIIMFLIPTLEVWGLSRATGVINQLLLYLPNVIVAVVIGFIGSIIANLGADLVKSSIKSMGVASANTMAMFTRSTIIFFTILVIMNQLGVAQDLIRILFTGIVAMLAIAGGLAFGLGGKDLAKEILKGLKKKIK